MSLHLRERMRSWNTLAVRLMLAQTAVLLIGLVAVSAIAALVGPNLFHRELVDAGHAEEAYGLGHLENAVRQVILGALAVGGLPALYLAGVLSFFLHRTISRSLASFTSAARAVAAGDYSVHVASPGLGPEFDSLAASFNDMARKLDAVETTRRQMLADLAHEMRTPLASLQGHLEGIEDGVVALDERTTSILQAQITRLERLTRDIRQLTRAEEGLTGLQTAAVDLAQLAQQAVAAIEPVAAQQNVTVTATGVRTAPVMLDGERMGQVLGNLLENSLRHTPPGGTVTVHTDLGARWATVTVTDTGEGIAEEALPHVFERFYRAGSGREHDRGGSGLGLAISRALVEAQGGTLDATSPGHGRGATFRVRLPRSAPAT
ncbi:putative sensor histidine kinase [Kocuria dechangensis]|uniref:histidine kinase n=1 Tax=Kocuria dechangensis TaxID=1176249 RepID=A0A917GEM6_9MICC|nr:HAMP domain-containing sensor histidine kinase [Kocuria dechangensis]GGG41785.1 putative sensor histidine kinase [Kocuria dechangensis]